jgi:hypothetical protein
VSHHHHHVHHVHHCCLGMVEKTKQGNLHT